MCHGGQRCFGIAKRSTLPFRQAAFKLCWAIVQLARCVYDAFCMACCVRSGLRYAWPYHERVGLSLVLERMINMSGEGHINDALVWGYERGGSYVLCSNLRGVASVEVCNWMDHACWTMGGEVRRVGLRAGRFVEVGPRTDRFVEAWYILGPWSSNCMGKWISSFICIIRRWFEILGYRVLRLSNLDEIK